MMRPGKGCRPVLLLPANGAQPDLYYSRSSIGLRVYPESLSGEGRQSARQAKSRQTQTIDNLATLAPVALSYSRVHALGNRGELLFGANASA